MVYIKKSPNNSGLNKKNISRYNASYNILSSKNFLIIIHSHAYPLNQEIR